MDIPPARYHLQRRPGLRDIGPTADDQMEMVVHDRKVEHFEAVILGESLQVSQNPVTPPRTGGAGFRIEAEQVQLWTQRVKT